MDFHLIYYELKCSYCLSACGYIFCKKCSKAQVVLEYEQNANKRSRVCDFCFDHLFKTFRSQPPTIEQINQRFRMTSLVK